MATWDWSRSRSTSPLAIADCRCSGARWYSSCSVTAGSWRICRRRERVSRDVTDLPDRVGGWIDAYCDPQFKPDVVSYDERDPDRRDPVLGATPDRVGQDLARRN